MSDQKNIRMELKNGMILRIPKDSVQSVVIPGIVIRDTYHRLVLVMDNYDRMLEQLRRRFNYF